MRTHNLSDEAEHLAEFQSAAKRLLQHMDPKTMQLHDVPVGVVIALRQAFLRSKGVI